MSKTQKLLEQVTELERQAVEQMAVDYPVGTKIKWKHGERHRKGQVIGHSDATPRLEACTSRCARVWVDVAALE